MDLVNVCGCGNALQNAYDWRFVVLFFDGSHDGDGVDESVLDVVTKIRRIQKQVIRYFSRTKKGKRKVPKALPKILSQKFVG